MTTDDLPGLAWSGSPLHIENMAGQLKRARVGVVDYLVVCIPSGASVAKGGIDYETKPGAGSLTQFAVRAEFQSLGIGTFLIGATEDRIRARGLCSAELDVEENNPRARALYERLGYVAFGRQLESWDQQRPDGTIEHYETMCTLMRKDL
ncbi:GNAT family N-acetyltransferase [Actinopolymorpha alba]|uniref:GNAT family N-acetyltransferase n=1 Tax=Actinopolymorpha alba TaxID=533267 RepID=UPI0012F6B2C3|nr:N-acetyltransferase [Actinopolymorpha alba]